MVTQMLHKNEFDQQLKVDIEPFSLIYQCGNEKPEKVRFKINFKKFLSLL